MKNVEKAEFDQRLECAAPKRWSKFITVGFGNEPPFYIEKISPGLQLLSNEHQLA